MVEHYNLSGYDNATDIYRVFKASNTLADGYLFSLIFLFAGFMILFISLRAKYDTVVAMIGSSFIISIIAVGGFALGLVSQGIMFIPIFILIGSVLAYMLSD